MTPEEHAHKVYGEYEKRIWTEPTHGTSLGKLLERLIAAAIRWHEAEVRKEIADDAKIVGIDERALGVRRPSYYDPWKDET